jgi:hypothetical protein
MRMNKPASQLLTSIADSHQLLLLIADRKIRAVVLLPEHPYYQLMVPQIAPWEGEAEGWQCTHRNFWGRKCKRSFGSEKEAKLYAELLVKPLHIEEVGFAKADGLELADVACADRMWRKGVYAETV